MLIEAAEQLPWKKRKKEASYRAEDFFMTVKNAFKSHNLSPGGWIWFSEMVINI